MRGRPIPGKRGIASITNASLTKPNGSKTPTSSRSARNLASRRLQRRKMAPGGTTTPSRRSTTLPQEYIPRRNGALQAAFDAAFMNNLVELWAFALPAACVRLNPVSEEYFRRTRKAVYGKTMEETVPKGEEAVRARNGFEEGLGKVDAWYQKNGGKGRYLLGEALSWGDIAVAGFLIWSRIIWGEESKEWKDIGSWHGGRWKALLESLKEYETFN
ncbi:hypothetical protein NLJ89_g4437 [Agrocybe chaxingu]|uniref:Glutathione S-transferase UstS-like C-terminal domain-containing protein n=1 Tax=Agrocybe chaxingu TaxID=84603 RepID=A0A9W8MVZ0_9AGAR|nr:hypothetical protein NLJ89_g4437 [Agrocybe chaxingu]